MAGTARLPSPGKDDGTWGGILNFYLQQSHASDGSLLPTAVSNALPSPIPTAKLGSGSASNLTYLRGDGTWATPAGGGTVTSVAATDATVTVSGTANAPTLAVGLIPESSVINLTTDLAAKAPKASPTFTGTVTVPAPVNGTDATTKTYVDAQVSSGTADATTSSKGKVQLAGDLAGTAAAPTVAKVNGITLPASAPTTGNVLTATSSTATAWSTPAAGVILDTTASDIVADTTTGTAVAGSTGKAADAGHQHPLVAHDHTTTNKGGQIPLGGISATGTASSSTYLRGDGSWSTPAGGVILDTTASDIQPLGSQAAGSTGKAADAGHVHAMPRLDQAAAPTSAVALGAQKITGLANGTVSTDAAAFGQIPNVGTTAVGGDLSGTVSTATVAKINGVAVSGTPSSGQVITATSSAAATWQTPTTGSGSSALPTLVSPSGLRRWDAALSDAPSALASIMIDGDSLSQGQGANNINVDDELNQVSGTWARELGRIFVRNGLPDPGEGMILSLDARWTYGGSGGTDWIRNTSPTRIGPLGTGFAILTTSGSASLPIETGVSAVELAWHWRPGLGAPVVTWTNGAASVVPPTPSTQTASINVGTGVWTLTSHGFAVGDQIGFGTVSGGATGINNSSGGSTASIYEVATVPDANSFTIALDGTGPTYGGTNGTAPVARVQYIKTILPNPDLATAGQNVIIKCASTSTRVYVSTVRKLKTTTNSYGVTGYATAGVQVNRRARAGYASADLDGTGQGVTSSTSKNIIKRAAYTVAAQRPATGVSAAVTLTQSTSLVNWSGHSLKPGDRVTFDTITGVTNLDPTVVYYVAANANYLTTQFQVSLTETGSAVTFAGANGTANATPRAASAPLLIIMLGANDYFNQTGTAGANRLGITPTTFTAYLQAAITPWIAEGGCVLLVGEPEHVSVVAGFTMQDYRDAMSAIAGSTDHVAYLSIAEVWGSVTNAHAANLQLSGSIHATRRGYADIARIIAQVVASPGRAR